MAKAGQIRVRSNVVVDIDGGKRREDAWSLVPGDLIPRFKPRRFANALDRRGRQFREYGYTQECVLCGRRIHEIASEGCDQEGCPKPNEAEVARITAARAQALRQIEQEKTRLADPAAQNERPIYLRRPPTSPAVELLSPEEAVDRMLSRRQ